MRNAVRIAGAVGVCLALGACVAGGVESAHAATGGDVSQLVLGFWHGLIAPVTLIVEIINRFVPHALPWQPHMYEKTGTGVIYDVGFWVGLASGPSILVRRRGH